jgi:hypothetical protein
MLNPAIGSTPVAVAHLRFAARLSTTPESARKIVRLTRVNLRHNGVVTNSGILDRRFGASRLALGKWEGPEVRQPKSHEHQ